MLSKHVGITNWLAASVLLLGVVFAADAAKTPRPLVDVSIDTPGGKRVRLADYKGKTLLIAILSTECKKCRESIAMLNDYQRSYNGKGVQIIAAAVNSDAPQQMRAFLDETRPAFPVGTLSQDNTRRLADFGISEHPFVPIFLFVDRKGIVQYQYSGDTDFFKDEKARTRNVLDLILRQ